MIVLNTNEPEFLSRPFQFLPGGGKTGHLIRSINWEHTSLGPVEKWPLLLKNALSAILYSRCPMIIFWGADHTQLYNDAFMQMIVEKHPLAMGMSAEECLNEAWPILWPQIHDVMLKRKASWNTDQLIPIIRNNRFEEVYWNYGMSPLLSQEGIPLGVAMVCSESTSQVLADRRMKSVLRLVEKTRNIDSLEKMLSTISEVAFEDHEDLPFVHFIHKDTEENGITPYLKEAGVFIPQLNEILRNLPLSWHETITSGFVLPLTKKIKDEKTHILFGLSPRLPFDWHYRDYLYRFVSEISTSINNMVARQKNQKLTASLKAAVAARDTFLGIASHELKNPLTSLKLRTEMNLRQFMKKGTFDVEGVLADYLKQIEKINLLVDDMLDITRIASGKFAINFERINLSQQLKGIIEGFRFQFLEKEIKVTQDIDPDLFCEGDAHRLEQVLANLFSNVTKYAPSSHLHISLKRSEGALKLIVADDGPGLSTEKKDLIFSKFERLGTKSKVSGLGLGLYICKNIIESHHGKIIVESALEKGTSFIVTLPNPNPSSSLN